MLGGQYWPTQLDEPFAVTWVHRDRTQQTSADLLSFLDASVGPEVGTTYNGFVYDDDTDDLLDSVTGLTGLSWSPAIVGTYTLRVEVESERDGHTSWQRQSWTLAFTGDEGRLVEGGEARTVEIGELRTTE
jgi:hypothetical protein